MDEISAQREEHDKQIAKVVSEASDRQAISDNRMARAVLDADVMKLAYDKLSIKNVEQQRTAARVGIYI